MPRAPHRPRPGRTREHPGAGGLTGLARRTTLLPAALPVLIVFGACSDEVPAAIPAPGPAPGAVLLVDEYPLTAEELTPLCRDIRELYPEYSLLHARRLALTNEHLPRLAARALEPARWQSASLACAAFQVAVGNEPVPTHCEGRFRGLGLGLWSAARHLPVGEWSAPLELTGRWLRVRLDARSDDADPLLETLQLSLLEFPYLDPARAQVEVERAIDRARLTLLDPEFAEAVPELWKHRMRGSPP